MNILIGDIGNTNTKICLVKTSNFKVIKTINFSSKNIKKEKKILKILKKIIIKKEVNKIGLFSSVVPKYFFILKKIINKNFKINLREIKEKKIDKIVKIKVKNINQLGSDRIANAVGVYKKYKINCIVVDLGTATTFDVVNKQGVYNGGIISPGIKLSIKSLSNSADQIPLFSLRKPKKIIGKNTIEALQSGFYWGYVGLINSIILKIENETNKKYKVIFTGGYAGLFKTSIKRPFAIDRNITISGIIEIFKKNKSYLIK